MENDSLEISVTDYSDLVTMPASYGPASRTESVDFDLSDRPRTVPEERAGGFGAQLAEHMARADLEQEVRRLRTDVETMRAELETLRAVKNVSPQYADAAALAHRGLSARDVADRMDISLAEAELVRALSRGGNQFDEGEDDGRDRSAGGDRFEPGIGYTRTER